MRPGTVSQLGRASGPLSRLLEDEVVGGDHADVVPRTSVGSAGRLVQLRVQVEDALGALNEGEDRVKQRREQLVAWETVLETSANAVEDLISDVALI